MRRSRGASGIGAAGRAELAVAGVAGLLLAAPALPAQEAGAELRATAGAPAADPADVASLDAIVAAVYDVISGPAGEARDWARMRSLFLPEARLVPSWTQPGGAVRYRTMTVDEWIAASEPLLLRDGFVEREIHRVTERYGRIAHLFSTYESRRAESDPEPFQRGINSFQLLHDGERWWILTIFWQGETAADPLPAAYLP